MIASAARPSSPSRRPSRASKSYSSAAPTENYYGHEETSKLAASFITYLFSCPDVPPTSSTSPTAPTPTLAQFIAYSLHRTRLAPSVTFSALFLLERLKSRFPAARGSSGHRLFISAFMIASKVVCDDTYSNKSWCVVGQGMFSLREINQMEREMCGYLEWVLNVPPQELEVFEARIRHEHGNGAPPKASPTVSSSATTTATAAPAALARPATTAAAAATTYPSPESTPPSPSHSNSTSPASSTCHTPPSTDATAAQSVNLPKTMKTGSEARLHRDPSFAFAAPAVW